ncbi:MAG: tRNA uridine-5-carboxymethylaminomethyl(34) synthesis GTPase MnmE [Bacteroidales bacterium]|nr:tRNA uridine-5-carboxymethylaminomethyl(34) synthesis GTPase MnmE [Bacteroidales bacterium]
MNFDDCICAPATIPGTGAISLIRVSGKDSIDIVDKIFKGRHSLADSPSSSIRYGTVIDGDGVVDEVLAAVFRAPHSYTGEDSVEISCHASSYIVSRILSLLCRFGARMAEPGEFTRRAFVNGKMDLAQAEAVADLIASSSEQSHRLALNQLRGKYSSYLKQLRDRLLELTALLELELDFSDEEVEFADRAHLQELTSRAIAEIEKTAAGFDVGNAIRTGVPVVIAGAPNSGKSTLLNAILGEQRAIVSDIPGTTRDTVEETITLDGLLYRFIDTAGIREADNAIEKLGIERSLSKLSSADVIIGVLDATLPPATLRENFRALRNSISSQERTLGESGLNGFGGDCEKLTAENGSRTEFSEIEGRMNLERIVLENDKSRALDCEKSGADLEGRHFGKSGLNGLGDDESGVNLNRKTFITVLNKSDVADMTSTRELAAEFSQYGKTVILSSLTPKGVNELLQVISESQRKRISAAAGGEGELVSNRRHYEALRNAAAELREVNAGLATSLPPELLSQNLRAAIRHLSSILGEITPDEILGEIFKKFCIGK